MNNEFGAVYEIVEFGSLPLDEDCSFKAELVDFFLPKGSVAGSLGEGNWLGVFADRHGEYPDLLFEMSQEGRSFVCDMDAHKARLLEHLALFLKEFPRPSLFPMLKLGKVLDAADGGGVIDVREI